MNTQRCATVSSVYGPLLSGVAVNVAGITQRWTEEQNIPHYHSKKNKIKSKLLTFKEHNQNKLSCKFNNSVYECKNIKHKHNLGATSTMENVSK